MKSGYQRLAATIAVATLGLVYLVVPTPVQAQSMQMTVNIPFEFYVGDKKLPAGEYKIMQQSSTGTSTLLIVGEHKSYPFVQTIPVTNPQPGRNTSIIFNKYANDLFLSEAHWRGTEVGRKLLASPRELELARNFALQRVVNAGRN
jgi:hypothetical protein